MSGFGTPAVTTVGAGGCSTPAASGCSTPRSSGRADNEPHDTASSAGGRGSVFRQAAAAAEHRRRLAAQRAAADADPLQRASGLPPARPGRTGPHRPPGTIGPGSGRNVRSDCRPRGRRNHRHGGTPRCRPPTGGAGHPRPAHSAEHRRAAGTGAGLGPPELPPTCT